MLNQAKMMADAYRLRKAIEAEVVEVEESGIKVIMGGDQKVKQIVINGSDNNILKDVVNKAIRKVQETVALKMKEMMNFEDNEER
jgi:DNA-binding protein YbaB